MSTNNKKNTNTENFNEMLRRTSSRLRGGSVPPPDSELIVPDPVVPVQRGRGRGRGRSRGRGNTSESNYQCRKMSTPLLQTFWIRNQAQEHR